MTRRERGAVERERRARGLRGAGPRLGRVGVGAAKVPTADGRVALPSG